MAKRQAQSVYRIVDVVGESSTSWEEAGRRAVETAATSIRDLRLAEVVKMDMKVENGKVTAFRTRVAQGAAQIVLVGRAVSGLVLERERLTPNGRLEKRPNSGRSFMLAPCHQRTHSLQTPECLFAR